MSTTITIDFPIKSLNDNDNYESKVTSLKLKVPDYYNSTNQIDKSNYIIHRAFQKQLASERQGSACSKTRAEVRGGGRKPWRQKGTGRARAGSNTSPLWKGGGVIFGPKPKTYIKKINKKERRLALRLLLAKKADRTLVVDNFSIKSTKTKYIFNLLKQLKLNLENTTLIITDNHNLDLLQATKNLKNIELVNVKQLNIKQLLQANNILLSQNCLKIIEDTYNV